MADDGAQTANAFSSADTERRRAISIFRYLHDLAQLKTAVVRDLDSYERVFWLDLIRSKQGCTAQCFRPDPGNEWFGEELIEDDEWFRVRKFDEPIISPPPQPFLKWLAPGWDRDADTPPRLVNRILRKPKNAELSNTNIDDFELLDDHPEINAALNEFTEKVWKPWAKEYKAWRDFQENVYSPLFSIHRDLKRLGEEFELIVGVGCLTWTTPGKHQVRRHLITAQVTLEFDPADGLFTLRPGSDGANLAIESEMLEAAEQPTIPQLDVIKSDLNKADDNPWDFETIDVVLRGFVQAVDKDGAYHPLFYRPRQTESKAQVSYAPALMLRRRSSRGVLNAFKSVIEQLIGGAQIPLGVLKLTSASERAPVDVSDESPSSSGPSLTGRIYFPLPANEDQRQIVELFNNKHGVLVQGPPGTGKSHTIANLICHLLATGNKVLITAQTPRALQVLREKLPAEVRALCLTLLGNDKAAQDNVEDSVRRITEKADHWNTGTAAVEIRNADQQLDQLFKREAVLERELRIFREMETHEHTVADGTYRGTAQAIALRLRHERPQFTWFADAVAPDRKPEFSADDLRKYREGLLRMPPQRIAELDMHRPARGSEVLLELVRDHHRLRERVQLLGESKVALLRVPTEELKAAQSAIARFLAAVQQLPVSGTKWASLALADLLRGVGARWKLLASQTSGAIEMMESLKTLEVSDIRLPDNSRLDVLLAKTIDLIAHLQNGGRKGFWIFRPKVVSRTIYDCRACTVDGRACENVETLTIAKTYLKCLVTLDKTWGLWLGRCEPTTKNPAAQVDELRELVDVLNRILAVGPLATAASAAVARLGLAMPPAIYDLPAMGEVAADCEREITRAHFGRINAQIASRVDILRAIEIGPNGHPVCARIAQSVEGADERELLAALEELRTLEADAAILAELTILDTGLRSTLPKLAQSLRETPTDTTWNDRFEKWTAAWRWAQAEAWLKKYADSLKAIAVGRELRQAQDRIGSLLEHVSAMRAWSSCLSAMSSAQQQHLGAWRQAIKKIGKGTGKHAGRWRREAQAHLEHCRSAIPAWVMPLYRVFESIKPAPGIFDVVIVDEASQCGPESLLLFYLAKKVIVVGDDMQISPSNIGVNKDEAKALLSQHLDGIDLASTFDVDNSLFEHGRIRLGKRITLREHFRCVPDVIRFSNDLCYNGSLIPLRQYPPQRLAPFVARFFPEGLREGSAQHAKNDAEAEAIAATIEACCRDPMYRDKTMGVISLLGEHQAKRIERLLLERIGAEEIERRKIVCGDAYSFQGDERNVIFLSMVASMGSDGKKGFAALTKSSDMQRFNVAASRAQDQLWLFHSLMPEDVGNRECMRYRLLTYFYDPARHAADGVGVDVESLREIVVAPDRPENPPQPFDSWFEVEVFLRVVARGFRVLPQYEAGRYRIDLVVEGQTRLAIECDGDRWHGPEKFDEDTARQRQLMRAGWEFWRLPGHTFDHDPDAALMPLWALLERRGIQPMPALDGSGSSEGYVPTVSVPTTATEPTISDPTSPNG